MQVGEQQPVNVAHVEARVGLAEHLSDGVGAVHQHPMALRLDHKGGGVAIPGEGVPGAEG